MKVSRQLLTSLLLMLAFVVPSNGCGPFSTEAVFVQQTRPDGPYAEYARGRLGVPQGRYRIRHLVIAYDWLSGAGLSPSEQGQAVAVDNLLNPPDGTQPDDGAPAAGVRAWIAAAGVSHAAASMDRSVPGNDYSSFSNCLDDAFGTAARTLTARRAAHAADAAALADWLKAQDAVFANCGGGSVLPEAVAAGAPRWLVQDRAYQVAAAKFYATDYDGAIAGLRAIAADATTPWHETARLVMARALIRRATVGQSSSGPAVAPVAPVAPTAPYSKSRAEAQQQYAKHLLEQRGARLTEARDALQAILSDPAMSGQHQAAERLLDYVMLRLNPALQSQTLAARLTAATRPQTAGSFRQGLIDITYLLGAGDSATPGRRAVASQLRTTTPGSLAAWIGDLQVTDPSDPLTGDSGDGDASRSVTSTDSPALTEAARATLAEWRSSHSAAWLVAAMAAARPTDPAVPELVSAAAAVAPGSAAWVAATYGRLRLTAGSGSTRAEIDTILPGLAREGPRSTVNLFTDLRLRSAPTLQSFLADAGAVPAGILIDAEDPSPPADKNTAEALCGGGTKTSEAATRLFGHDAATILNTRMPVRLLADAAADNSLPLNLRFQIAQSAWTRAVLLQRPEIARRITTVLTGCYPAWKPWLEKYDAAGTTDEQQVTGLLALMRFASTQPIVRDGEQREEGFATYSSYRDNWWEESKPATETNRGQSAMAPIPPTFFGTSPADRKTLPDPPFLTAVDRADAEKEVTALRAVPCASDYFAKAALSWQQGHPSDPRTLDVLGFAERVIRNGCHTDQTNDLNHRLFDVVQTRYPGSTWAKRYPTWDKKDY